MARPVAHEELTHTEQAAERIGDVFPGLHAEVRGVRVANLSIGLVETLLLSGLRQEFASYVNGATRGLSEKKAPTEFAAAKQQALAAAVAAFSDNILPSTAETADDHAHGMAVDLLRANMEKQASRHPGGAEEFQKAWYLARYTDEERDAADQKNSRSRSLCLRRLARRWLAMDLPEAAAAQREKILAAAQERANESNAAARARVIARQVSILTAGPAPVESLANMDETDLGL
jgi:hypothetical protein